MCTIGYDGNTAFKIKEPGLKNYECLVLGYEGDKFVESFLGSEPTTSVDINESIRENEKRPIEMANTQKKVPQNEREIPPDFPVKQAVLSPTEELPYIMSASHDNYGSGWGGSNPEISVFTSAVRHHNKGEYRPYAHLVTEMLEKYESCDECVNYLRERTEKEKIRGFNFSIMDQKDRYLVEYVPEDLKRDSFQVKKIDDDIAETNFSVLNNFFWSEDWKPYKGDLNITQHFIRSLNRYIALNDGHDFDLEDKLTCHIRYEDLFDTRNLQKAHEMFKEGDLQEIFDEENSLEISEPIEEPSFYTNCTHNKIDNIGEETPPQSFKETAWAGTFDRNNFDIIYGQPCESNIKFSLSMSDLEELSEDFSRKYSSSNPRKKDI